MANYGGIEDYQILQHYLAPFHSKGELKPGINIQNPLILDTQATPSFGIGKGKKGDYIYKDFATEHEGTAINLVMELFGYTFPQAIERVKRDFGLSSVPKKFDKPVEVEVTFDIEFKEFSDIDLEFWVQGNINPIKSGILCVDFYKRNDEKAYKVVSSKEDPIFAYKITDTCYKIYRPFSNDKRFKFGWLGKKPSEYVYGYDRLPEEGEIVILCAGEKDTETAIAFGYPSICLNSETTMPSADLLFDINSRFKIFACCYDLDETGKKQTEKLKKIGLAPIYLPEKLLEFGNDLFDFAKNKDKFDVTFNDLVEETKAYNRYAVFNKPYRMTLDLDVPQGAITMKFKGCIFLKRGNIATIVAGAGIGKSQTCDAISALVLNKNIDALGFSIESESVSNILHIDTERDPDDHKLGYLNIFRRAKELAKDSDRLHYWSYKMNETAEANRDLLQLMLAENKYDLVILDGIADFINDVNDNKETKQFVNWLTIFAQRNDTSIIVTVHENVNSNGKATGHLGSDLWKKSCSMLRLRNNKEDVKIKELTTEFDLGKLRSGSIDGGYVCSHFSWDNTEDVNMYVSLDESDIQNMNDSNSPKKTSKWYLDKIFYNDSVALNKQNLSNQLSSDYELSGSKIRTTMKDWIDFGWVSINEGVYQKIRKETNALPNDVYSTEFEFNNEDCPF